MKKISYFMMMLFVATLSFAFTSCGSDDDDTPAVDSNGNPSIEGTWTFSLDDFNDVQRNDFTTMLYNKEGIFYDELKIELNFNKGDGTVERSYRTDGIEKPQYFVGTFTYSLSWNNDGVGKLIISNVKGSEFLSNKTYELNKGVKNNDDIINARNLIIEGITFNRK